MLVTKKLIGVALMVAAVLASNTLFAAPPAKEVEVVNTPLPVTGNVEATVTGDMNVTNFPEVQEVTGVLEVTQNQPEFLGITTQTVGASVGWDGMNYFCKLEFDEAAHFCSSEEIFRSYPTDIGPSVSQSGWVQPVMQYIYHAQDNKVCGIDTISGVMSCQPTANPAPFAPGSLSCQNWITQEGVVRGLEYFPGWGFSTRSCSSPAPISCCK